MASEKSNYYFDCFVKSAGCASDAAALLKECLENYDMATLSDQLIQMHRIEHHADDIKHDMLENLMKEFLPPIEREDIVELADMIDDVTDSVEEVLRGMYMHNIVKLRRDVHEFANIIFACCFALCDAVAELYHFRKSAILRQKIVEINRLEEECDQLYTEAVHRLYAQEKDPIAVMAWAAMYDRLETCCDICEDAADKIEQIILKNS